MPLIAWIGIGLVAWIALALVAARFCATNTISEERDQRVVDAAAEELREDMRDW